MASGSLTIVGTGMQAVSHLTLAARAWIEQADKVLFAVADPVTAEWLRTLNPTAEALPVNTNHQRRRTMHQEMVARILAEVRQGRQVCAVFYGHPGVFVDPAHEAIRQARRAGFPARMLPGISAADCLYADLGLDPGRNGCQSFEATDFLIRRRKFDPSSILILWQVGVIGELGFGHIEKRSGGLTTLAEVLETSYGANHEVIIYEAAIYPVCQPVIQRVALANLSQAEVSDVSLLYIPPRAPAPVDTEMMARLGMSNFRAEG